MIEFLKIIENRSIEIALVNSILITKSINLQLFTRILCVLGVRCDQAIFSAQSIYRKVYGATIMTFSISSAVWVLEVLCCLY